MMKNSSSPIKYAVAGVAAVALAFGAYTVGNSGSSNGNAGTANAAQPGQVAGPPAGMGQQRDGPPGFGTPVTGTTATKVKAAALAKYHGKIERITQLPGGLYVAHVITSHGELHVTVSKGFKVTGAQQGGPGGPPGAGAPGAMPPGAPGTGTQGAMPPSGAGQSPNRAMH